MLLHCPRPKLVQEQMCQLSNIRINLKTKHNMTPIIMLQGKKHFFHNGGVRANLYTLRLLSTIIGIR